MVVVIFTEFRDPVVDALVRDVGQDVGVGCDRGGGEERDEDQAPSSGAPDMPANRRMLRCD